MGIDSAAYEKVLGREPVKRPRLLDRLDQKAMNDPKQTTIEAVERIITGMTLTAS